MPRPVVFRLFFPLFWAAVTSSALAGWRTGANPTPAQPRRADLAQRAAEVLDGAGDSLTVYADLRIDECNKTIALDPADDLAFCRRAEAWADKGEYKNALADYDAAARLSPKSVDIYVARAGLKEELGRYAEAAADYTSAIVLDPSDAELHYRRAGVYEAMARYDEALDDYDAAHRLDPEQTDVLLARGDLLVDLGRREEAIADFTQLLDIDPRDLDAYFQRGLARRSQGDYEAAIADLSEVVRADHTDGAALASRADAWAALGNSAQALADIEEAEALSTDDGDTRYALGDAWRALGRYDKAVEHYRAAARLIPDDPTYTVTLAMILAAAPVDDVRDGQEALRLAKEAVQQTDTRDAYALFALAAAYAELGRFDSAAAWQERAIELASDEDRETFQNVLELYRERRPWRDEPDLPATEAIDDAGVEGVAEPRRNRSRLRAAWDDNLPSWALILAAVSFLGLVGLAVVVALFAVLVRRRGRREP